MPRTHISVTASPTPQNLASSSMPSSLMTVLSTSKHTASVLRKSSLVSESVAIVLEQLKGGEKTYDTRFDTSFKQLSSSRRAQAPPRGMRRLYLVQRSNKFGEMPMCVKVSASVQLLDRHAPLPPSRLSSQVV